MQKKNAALLVLLLLSSTIALAYTQNVGWPFTWPSGPGTSGQVLTTDGVGTGTWQTPATASPGGSSGDVQINSGGSFGGQSYLNWNGTQLLVGNASHSGDAALLTSPINTLGIGASGETAQIYGVPTRSGFGFASDAFGLRILSGAAISNVSNAYGLWAEAPSGASANYAAAFMGGNVGIGISSPASPLTVAGMIESTSGGFKFPDSSIQTTAVTPTTPAGSSGAVQYNNGGAFAGDEINFFWDDSGKRLGIGTSTFSFGEKLGVVGDIRLAGDYSLLFSDPSSSIQKSGQGLKYIAGSNMHTFFDYNANDTIGVFSTVSSKGTLQLKNQTTFRSASYDSNAITGPLDNPDQAAASFTLQAGTNICCNGSPRDGGNLYLQSGQGSQTAPAGVNGSVIFGSYTTETARIDPDGNFGIGTASPDTKLEVNGAVKIDDAGGNGGNVPHEYSKVVGTTATTSATCSAQCPANAIAVSGDCASTSVPTAMIGSHTSTTSTTDDTFNCDYLSAAGDCTATAKCFQY